MTHESNRAPAAPEPLEKEEEFKVWLAARRFSQATAESAPASAAPDDERSKLMREAAFMLQNSMFEFFDTSCKAVDLARRIQASLALLTVRR